MRVCHVPDVLGRLSVQPVAEGQHPPDLLAPLREQVQVHPWLLTWLVVGQVRGALLEQAVLVPLRLPQVEGVAGLLQRRNVRRFVGRVTDERRVNR